MHDSRLEDLLRSTLRAEGERLPLSIDALDLHERLAARRRSRGSSRFALVAAAVAIVAIGLLAAAANGWLRLPATDVATPPSPSPSVTATETPHPSIGPSPAPVAGLDRIAPTPGGTVLFEVEPTVVLEHGESTFTTAVSSDQWIVQVSIRCTGSGTVTLVLGENESPVGCEIGGPGAQAIADAPPALVRFPVPNQRVEFGLVVTPDVRYTVLAETIPLPARLPELHPPEGTVAAEAASPHDAPISDHPSPAITEMVGTLPDGNTQAISAVCLGPGSLTYALGAPGTPQFLASGEQVCDGEPTVHEVALGAEGSHELYVTVDPRIAWHVIGASRDDPPAFVPPSLWATSWPAARGPAGLNGRAGCGLSFELADGRSGVDGCGEPEWPSMAEEAQLLVPTGGELRFVLDGDWVMVDPVVEAIPARDAGTREAVAATRLGGHDGRTGRLDVPIDLAEGDWVVRVRLTGTSGGDRFQVAYFFPLRVRS
jgi:hypothetical protein